MTSFRTLSGNLAMTSVAALLLLNSTNTFAVESPVISSNGATITWPAIDAISINVHDASDGSWLETIPGDQTSWEAPYPGSFFMVGTDNGEWQNWGKSNVIGVEIEDEPFDDDADINLTNVRGIVYSSTALELFWDVPAGQNVDRVEIFRDDGVAPTTFVDGRSFFDQGLLPNTTYTYSLFPYDANDNIGKISNITLTTNSDGSVPQEQPVEDTVITNGLDQSINDPTPDNLIGVAAVVYSDSALELIWPRQSDHLNDLHHIVYQNGKQIATSNGYSLFVDGLQAGTTYAFEVRRVTTDGLVQDNYRTEARTRGTASNISGLSLNSGVIYQAIAPTAIAQIDADFSRVKLWLAQTHDVPGFDPENILPVDSIEFIGTFNCPLAGTVSVEQNAGPYTSKEYYTFDQCRFPQFNDKPNKFSSNTLVTFAVLNGRLERVLTEFSDSGGGSRETELSTDGFTATRHNGSVVSMQGSASEAYTYTVLKADSLPNGDAVQTRSASYALETFSDNEAAPGTRFEAIFTSAMSNETNQGINYTLEQVLPARMTNAAGTTVMILEEPILFNVTDDAASSNISLMPDNSTTVNFLSAGTLRTPVVVSTFTADGSSPTNSVAFHEEAHLPRDLITQFCVWHDCNFGKRIVDLN